MKPTLLLLPALLFSVLLGGCFDNDAPSTPATVDIQPATGQLTFERNCAVCHGIRAQGLTPDWRTPNPDGSFPAPPLNGSAHAWHHSPAQLLRTINHGGISMGGQMPGFEHQLSEAQKQSLINYIFSLWPANIQAKYETRFKPKQ